MAVTLSPTQLATLKASFTGTGPLVSQVQPLLHANPAAIAALYASTSSAGAGNVTKASADKNDVLLTIETAVVNLGGASTALQQKWMPIAPLLLSLLSAAQGAMKKVDVASLPSLVADGLLTQAQADAPWTRLGSYSEVLLGQGVFPTSDDIQAATELV